MKYTTDIFEEYVMSKDEIIEFLSKLNKKKVLDKVYDTLVKDHKKDKSTFIDWVINNNLMEYTTDTIYDLLFKKQPLFYRSGQLENMFDPRDYDGYYDWQEEYLQKQYELCYKTSFEMLMGRKIK